MLIPSDRRASIIVPERTSINVVSSAEADDFTYTGDYVGTDRKRLEYRYVLPLPREAAVDEAKLTVTEGSRRAYVLQPVKATEVAQRWARERRDPGFLEWFGRPIVVSDPFPLPRDEGRTFTLTYRAEPRTDSMLRRITVPAAALAAVPGDKRAPVVRIKVTGEEQPNLVYSPTHSAETRRQTDGDTVVSLEALPAGCDREALLYYGASSDEFHLEGLTYVPSDSEDPYFLLLIGGEQESIPAREIMFVLDISGSMGGAKVESAKAALAFCLDDLAPEDRFDLGLFRGAGTIMAPQCVPATTQAVHHAKSLFAPEGGRGMTNVEHALTCAVQVFSDEYLPKLVVVLTDGFATAGVTENQQIIESVVQANTHEARFLTVGVGDYYNRPLLEELARMTGGHHLHVGQSDELLRLLRDEWEQVAWGLWNLDIEADDFEPYALLPDPLPELIVDSPRIVVGRMRGVEGGNLTIRARTAHGPVQTTVKLAPNLYNPANGYIARLWANRQLAVEQDALWRFGYTDEQASVIHNLATRFALPTEVSLGLRKLPSIAQRDKAYERYRKEKNEEVREVMQARVVAQQLLLDELAARARTTENEWRYRSTRNWPLAYHDQSGRLHDATAARFVAGRAFELDRGTWTDTTIPVGATSRPCATFSSDYFALAKSDWRIAAMLSLGPNVVVSLPTGVVATRVPGA